MKRLPIDFTLYRYGLNVRFVQEEDAEFIINLRTTEKLGLFIMTTSSDIDAQREWIRCYKTKEANGEGYYFIYEVDGKPYGVNRISKFIGNDFEIGSWVFSPNSPFGSAIAADIILKEIAFDILGCENCFFDVRRGNVQVQKYHKRYKPQIIKETDLDIHFLLSKDKFEINKSIYLQTLNMKIQNED